MIITTCVDSPLGPLRLEAQAGALIGLYLPGHRGAPPVRGRPAPSDDLLRAAGAQLGEYFAGARSAFDLPLRLAGTSFQRAVWGALLDIGYGQRLSYGELARTLGRPGASRAVGAANGRNPISIVVPCHRVVGHDGRLTGYAGGEEAKRWLLTLEAPALSLDPGMRAR